MSWRDNFKQSPILEIGRWSGMRWPWLLIAFLSLLLVVIAHNIFQLWLYMKPCEQCVYIRFAFVLLALGALITLIKPDNILLRVAGLGVSIWGCIYGLQCSITLQTIHHAVHSDSLDALFGMQGCSLVAHYPFDLPLAHWAPSWFQQTGDCGYDLAVVPENVTLSAAQQFFIDMYNSADSWYLVPSMRFMSMAQCCVLAFAVALILLTVLTVSWGYRRIKLGPEKTASVKRTIN